jgi:hypothetical protein
MYNKHKDNQVYHGTAAFTACEVHKEMAGLVLNKDCTCAFVASFTRVVEYICFIPQCFMNEQMLLRLRLSSTLPQYHRVPKALQNKAEQGSSIQ